MLKNSIVPSIELHKRATEILGRVSFGLEIVSLEVAVIMQQSPMGLRPAWGIIYQAKGALIGSQNYIMQMTGIGDPFLPDADLEAALTEGCAILRAERGKQMNGAHK